jgi:hypothetical protein
MIVDPGCGKILQTVFGLAPLRGAEYWRSPHPESLKFDPGLFGFHPLGMDYQRRVESKKS